MCALSAHSFGSDPKTARAVLDAALYTWDGAKRVGGAKPPARTFVTVSRQPGANARSFAQRLTERLNSFPGGDWTAWDNELLDKVSAEHGIEKRVIEAVEEQPNTWLDDFVQGFAASGAGHHVSEFGAYKRIAMTIRALAAAGHAVLVGRGAQFVTAGLPGGVHVRLIAPLEHRIKYFAKTYDLDHHQAALRVAEAEHNRKVFYHRYWSGREITAETFALTLNAGELSVDELVECVLPLVQLRDGAAATTRK